MVPRLRGGSIDVHKGNYYLSMGIDTNHPSVSGLNAHGGINMHGHSISNCNGIGNDQGDLNLASSGKISISPGTETWINNTLSGIVVNNGSGNMVSLSSLIVSKQGNGAQLGNLWVGDHVINDSLGSQISMDYNLDLYAKTGYNVRAGGEIVATRNWCNSNFEPKSSNINIKTQIQERNLKDIPDILRQIKLYDYKYIDDFYEGKSDYGYIIEYLEKIPNLNKYIDFIKDEYEDINDKRNKYSTSHVHTEHLIKFLLGSIVELQHQIDEIRR